MNNRYWAGALAAVTLSLAGAGDALASYPTGVWTRVDKVVYDNPADPTTIQIYGAIMVYVGGNTGKWAGYTDPAMGYLYYTCPDGQKATCQMEWKDIEANIGAPMEECSGFGDQMTPTGTLRDLCDAPADPDPYPIVMGVVGGFTPCAVINEYLATNPDTMCANPSGSGGSGSGGSNTGGSNTGGSNTGGSNAGSGGSAGSGTAGSGTAGTAGSGTAGSDGGGGSVKSCSCSMEGTGGEAGGLGAAVLALGLVIGRRRRNDQNAR